MCFTYKSWWDAVISSSLVLTADVWKNVDNPQASEISKFTSFTVFALFQMQGLTYGQRTIFLLKEELDLR